jgi:hypothetical protein
MAANGEIGLQWGDGEHAFNVAKIKQVFELEEKAGCGVFELFERLRTNRARFSEVREIIRLGLIGAGMKADAALTFVDRYIEEWPLLSTHRVAFAVLGAALVGVPGDPVGKPPADRTASEAVASSDPPSTEPAPQ